jgi:membrane protein implicated in regulation of membrane protease activity
MSAITLEQYEAAEREVSLREALIGLRVHALVIVLVWAAVIPVNIFVAPGFPWSAFIVAGTAIGVFFHWFGYRHARQDIRRRQQRIEQRAATR